MPVKAFNVYVELDVQAVTCPGVWLCPNGRIILKVYMFGKSARTSHLPPIFPLLYHQKFIFHKTFSNVRYLTDLQHLLGKEYLFAELVQCTGGASVVLASFETTIFELLYPSPCIKGLIAGVDVDLLMEPTKCFPGILAPKIEVSTKTTIEEIVDSSPSHKRNPGVINPKMLHSKYSPAARKRLKWKVCQDTEKLPKSPKLRKKSLSSRKPCPKQNCSSFNTMHNNDDNSSLCTCCHCDVETTNISPKHSQNAETLQGIPKQLPIWTSASGRVYSPSSYFKILKEPLLDKDKYQTKHKKTRKDYYYKKCHSCCRGDEDPIHKSCNCSVCQTYRMYFDKQHANQCTKQAEELSKCICSTSKKQTCCEKSSFLDKCCCVTDKIGFGQKQVSHSGKSHHREEFYRGLEKFYRKLHKQAKQRASEEV